MLPSALAQVPEIESPNEAVAVLCLRGADHSLEDLFRPFVLE